MDKSAETVRILLADDHPILRHGLRKLLEAEPGLRVIGEAADGVEAVKTVRELRPDLPLLELNMPRQTGLEALREIGALSSTRTVVLAAAIEKAEVARAIQLGARGVVLKESATELLLRCIRAVMGGQYWARGRHQPDRGAARPGARMATVRMERTNFASPSARWR